MWKKRIGGLIFLLLAVASVAQRTPDSPLKGIHYKPSPLGDYVRSGLGDVYRDEFNFQHSRDIPALANSGATTILLDPWSSSQKHGRLFNLARRHGLTVVPQFELDSRTDPDIFSAGGIAYLADRFNRWLDELTAHSDVLEMIQIGNAPNKARKDGGYQPLSGFFNVIPVLAAIKADRGLTSVPILVALDPSDGLSDVLSTVFDYSVGYSVDVWDIGTHTDWSSLTFLQGPTANKTNVMVQLSFSSWDPVQLEQNETLQLLGLEQMWTDVQVHGAGAIMGYRVMEWADVATRESVQVTDSTPNAPRGVQTRKWDGISKIVFAHGRNCIRPKLAYNWLSDIWGGRRWSTSALKCYPLIRLMPLSLLLTAALLGLIGVGLLIISLACTIKNHGKRANVRYIPLAPDSRTDPFLVAINESIDALQDAALVGNSSISPSVLVSDIETNLSRIYASLSKMTTSQQTRQQLAELIQSLQQGARRLLDGCEAAMSDDELDEELIREIQVCAAQMKDSLNSLEVLRDRDIASQFGASQARRPGSPVAAPPPVPVAPAGGMPTPPVGRAADVGVHRRTSNTTFSV